MRTSVRAPLLAIVVLASIESLACIRPPTPSNATEAAAGTKAVPPPLEKMTEIDAWGAVPQMTPGINIGNTLDNTTIWETGWGNPPITKEYVQTLARLGFKTVRLPVAWDTYADEGVIPADKLARVREIVDWITGAGMFCVLNIHWDGGWIDSDKKDKFPATFATFSAEAEKKYRSYWTQISTFFAGKNEKLIFEALNEETNFSGEGSMAKAYATLTRVNQIFIDTVRKTGGNNARRLLLVIGYSTDIEKTCASGYQLPKDTIPGHLFISVHYYTPYQFCGLTEDADWGKMMPTWGTPEDVNQLTRLFDKMNEFCVRNDIPAFIGEFNATEKKESASRVRWLTAVANASTARRMIPVLWDTGHEVSRSDPYAASPELTQMLHALKPPPAGRPAATPAAIRAVPGLPAAVAWTSTAPLILPKSDAAHPLVAVKDPTVVRYHGRWHVYASSVAKGGVYGIVYTSFANWSEAPRAPLYYMDQTRGFKTYVAAPQLFYFTPQKKWYLVFQSGPPMFSTADDPGDPTKWTEPAPFFAKTPAVVDKNGGWLDFWVICDADRCHLFFSNDHGRWYRSDTPIAKFPYGFSDPVVVLEDAEAGRVFEACNVYKIGGTNKYLALIEAFDRTSDSRRYFRSWTADSLEGRWTVLHDDAAAPFAGERNVSFQGPPWSRDISHGEMVRAGYDETMVIDGAKLQYLYQGFDPSAPTADYNAIPWRLGLLTLSQPK